LTLQVIAGNRAIAVIEIANNRRNGQKAIDLSRGGVTPPLLRSNLAA
jgi:hypothetical protein